MKTKQLSEYHLFVREHRKLGKTMKDIGIMWRERTSLSLYDPTKMHPAAWPNIAYANIVNK